MKRLAWEQAVNHAVSGRPHLLPIFGDVLGIVDRIREYNPDLFAVLNVVRLLERAQGLSYKEWTPVPPGVMARWNAWYEIHNLTERPTLVMSVRYGALDSRILRDLWETDVQVHGDRFLDELQAHNERLEQRRQREFGNQLEAAALDARGLFARGAWGPSVFGPGGTASTGYVLPGIRS